MTEETAIYMERKSAMKPIDYIYHLPTSFFSDMVQSGVHADSGISGDPVSDGDDLNEQSSLMG